MSLDLLAENRCFGGVHRRYRHDSRELNCAMEFAVYLPPRALQGASVPCLYWLSGLTCTDENVMQKSGIQRTAAALGLAIVAPDTSPRGEQVPSDPDGCWDFGHGAGFYVDATQAPWSKHYRMQSYVVEELPSLVERSLPVTSRRGLCGHSMGGHGALICALRHPERFQSVSAFSPICHPMQCPWGQKAFTRFFGDDRSHWGEWDATQLIRGLGASASMRPEILIDQGGADPYLEEQLRPQMLINAASEVGCPVNVRFQEGYDHSYFFIASFIDDHLHHHASILNSVLDRDV